MSQLTAEDLKATFDAFNRHVIEGVMKHYDAGGLTYCKPVPPVKRQTRDGSTVETSLGAYQNHWPELAFDGRADTFFWADRDLKDGDHLTVHLKSPITTESTVSVVTGGTVGKKSDALDNGLLEASPDGSSWREVSAFANGKASGKDAAGTRHLRIRVTAPHPNWLIVNDIEVR